MYMYDKKMFKNLIMRKCQMSYYHKKILCPSYSIFALTLMPLYWCFVRLLPWTHLEIVLFIERAYLLSHLIYKEDIYKFEWRSLSSINGWKYELISTWSLFRCFGWAKNNNCWFYGLNDNMLIGFKISVNIHINL